MGDWTWNIFISFVSFSYYVYMYAVAKSICLSLFSFEWNTTLFHFMFMSYAEIQHSLLAVSEVLLVINGRNYKMNYYILQPDCIW